jgi:hypothetical protein
MLDYYNSAMEAYRQMGGYASRFVDIFSSAPQLRRSPGAVALFERCLLPALCAQAKLAVTHRLPYTKMHHFSQVGQDVWAMRHFNLSSQVLQHTHCRRLGTSESTWRTAPSAHPHPDPHSDPHPHPRRGDICGHRRVGRHLRE